MFELVLWLLSTIGLTNIIVHGKVLDDEHLGWRTKVKDRLGKFGDMLECYECSGWWSGLLTGIFLVSFNPLWILASAFAGAAVMHAYSVLSNFIESKTDFYYVGDANEQPDE